MTRVIEVLQTILPVMIMLCIGMICRSRQLISREASQNELQVRSVSYDRIRGGDARLCSQRDVHPAAAICPSRICG